MALFRGTAVMRVVYTVDADDVEQAKEFIIEMADEEFRGLSDITTENIKEVK